MRELTISRCELKMILSYGIGTSEVERILEKYDDDGDKGRLISDIIGAIYREKFITESLKTRLKVLEEKLATAGYGNLPPKLTQPEPGPERD